MPATTKHGRLGLPAKFSTVARFIEALGSEVNDETIVRAHNGELVIETPTATLPGTSEGAE